MTAIFCERLITFSFKKDLKSNTVINNKYRIQIHIDMKPVIKAINFDLLMFICVNQVILKVYQYDLY